MNNKYSNPILCNFGSGHDKNVQSDWTSTDTTSDTYILHKPTIEQTTGTSTTNIMSQDAITTAINAKVEDSITDEHTTVAPSGNAVYDALALKLDKTSTGDLRRVYGVDATNAQELTDIETTPTDSSTKLVTSGGIKSALDLKVDKVTGKGLSTEDYTTDEKTKLTGIETEANKTVVSQETGTSTTNVMSQNAVTTTFQPISAKDTASGYAGLNASGKVGTTAVGTLDTNNATAQAVPETAESFTADIDLHKISKTGTFSDLLSIPTTLSGYGITDAATSTQGSTADNAIQGVKCAGSALTPDANKVVDVTYTALGTVPVSLGGTGSTTASDALTSLGAQSVTDNTLDTTSKTVPGAINEINTALGALGTASACDTGTTDGTVPILDASGKLATTVETDPTVPAWAKAESKPSYTFSEIGTTPTTLSGYGITDGATATYADGKVEDSITDGHTTIAPSGNAVYDALALKLDKTSTGTTRRVYGVDATDLQELTEVETTPTDSSTKLITSGGVKTALDLKAPLASPAFTGVPTGIRQDFTATLPYASWTGASAPYTKAVTVTGILATDKPDIDLDLSSATYSDIATIQSGWANVYRGVTSADTITFYASTVPTIDIPLQIKVVR